MRYEPVGMSEDEKRWRAEDDLRTMKRAEEVKKDPDRVQNMKNYLREQRRMEKSIMGIQTPPPTPSRCNPATVMNLADPFSKR